MPFSKSHVLLPFPNRLQGGTFTFSGKTYCFPINEVEHNNNLHGFENHLDFSILKTIQSNNTLTIELESTFEGCSFYPFPFTCRLSYQIAHTSFTIQCTLVNNHKSEIPIAWGWHPYFKLTDRGIDNCKLRVGECQNIELGPQNIPTGKKQIFTDFIEFKPVQNKTLDHCFTLNKIPKTHQKQTLVELNYKNTLLSFWQVTGLNQSNFFQLYVPPNRKSIAIEPMSASINAFNTGEGLTILSPNQKVSFKAGVRLERYNSFSTD